MALSLIAIGSAALMETSFAFFAHDALAWGPKQVGLSFGAVGLVSVILQGGGAAPLAKRFGSFKLMIAGLIAYAIGLGGLTIATSGPTVLFSMSITAIGLGLFNPAFQTITSAQSNDTDRGLVNGLTQGASSLGRVVGPGVSGGIYQTYGITAPFAVGAVGLGIAAVLAIVTLKGRAGKVYGGKAE
jgi:MFS transporter, DHA1 family, tetracycline resistance protein